MSFGPRLSPQTTTSSPGATVPVAYDAAFCNAFTTGLATANWAGGMTSMVIEYAGNVALTPVPETGASAAATIAPAFAALYRHTFADCPGAKPFNPTVDEISPAVLFRTTTVNIESERRAAAKIESRSASLVVACTLVSPNAPPIPS